MKGGALSGPSMATTRELEAVSRPARNTPARKMAAMVNMVTSGHAGDRGVQLIHITIHLYHFKRS